MRKMRAIFVREGFQRAKASSRTLILGACGFVRSHGGARGIWIECVNKVHMLHNSLMPGDSINGFHHPCIGMSEQIGDLGGRKIGFFQLGSECGSPVMVIIGGKWLKYGGKIKMTRAAVQQCCWQKMRGNMLFSISQGLEVDFPGASVLGFYLFVKNTHTKFCIGG